MPKFKICNFADITMAKFQFRNFELDDGGCGLRVGSDSVLLAARFCHRHTQARHIADIGCGSGVLALLCADGCPDACIEAVEIDAAAAAVAASNFGVSPWADRLSILTADFASLEPHLPFDAIISNPPYFDSGLRANDPIRAEARHQRSLTFGALLDYGRRHLVPDGVLAFITPSEAENLVVWEGVRAGLCLRDLCRVRTTTKKDPTRILWEFSPSDGQYSESTLDMRNPDGRYTEQYLGLVTPFYHHIKQPQP